MRHRTKRTVAWLAVIACVGMLAVLSRSWGEEARIVDEHRAVKLRGDARGTDADVSLERSPRRVRYSGRGALTTLDVGVRDVIEGGPVSGAEVAVWDSSSDKGTEGARESGSDARLLTDARGEVTFELDHDGVYGLEVGAPGYATRTLSGCSAGSRIVVQLGKPATLEGRVVASEQGGIGNAEVAVRYRQGGRRVVTSTDHEGVFRIVGLDAGTVFVWGSAPQCVATVERRELVAGETQHMEILLPHGASVNGHVRDAVTGKGVLGAQISSSWTFRNAATSNNDGAFCLTDFQPTGPRDIHVRADGYATRFRRVEQGASDGLVVLLVPGGAISGRVVAEGVANVRIEAVAYGTGTRGRFPDRRRGKVEENGAFVVKNLRPDLVYALFVRAPGSACGELMLQMPHSVSSGECLDVGQITLARGRCVAGRVTGTDGAPLPDVMVMMEGASDVAAVWTRGNVGVGRTSLLKIRRNVRTDARGRFRIPNVAPGGYSVILRTQGMSRPARRALVVKHSDVSDIEFQVPVGKAISGEIALDGVTRVALRLSDFVVAAGTPGGSINAATVQDNGRFQIQGLEDGEYSLRSLRGPSGWRLEPRSGVHAGDRGVLLHVVGAGMVSGTVRGAGGGPAPASLWLSPGVPGAPGVRVGETDARGCFSVDVDPDFSGELSARRIDDPSVRGSAPVAAGDRGVEIVVH